MESEALARAVIAKLREAGHQAYLVAARCATCCWGPAQDFDVSTDARPERIMDLFPNRDKWARTSAWCWCATQVRRWRWPRFAATTNTPMAGPPACISRATRAGRAAPRLHHQRLMMEAATGEVLDYVGGRADLERRVVRAIGDPDAVFWKIICGCCARPFRRALEVRDRIRTFEAMARTMR